MKKFILLIIKYQIILTFIVLEIICVWIITTNNNYQRSTYISSSTKVVGYFSEKTNDLLKIFSLVKENKRLVEENAFLKQSILNSPLDDVLEYNNLISKSHLINSRYKVKVAEVIRNNFISRNNFFLIKKGIKEGIRKGMGVINRDGVVGKIVSVSEHYAEGISLLNTKNLISAKLSKNNQLGTVLWSGKNKKTANLLYITRDVEVSKGDTVVTSGYNAIFPKDIMIGTVSQSHVDTNQTYLSIILNLSVDFSSLSYVYIIENTLKNELDSLNLSNPLKYNE